MPKEILETPQPTEPKSTNWPKIILVAVLGFALLAGACYAGYRAYQYYQLNKAPDGWCSSARSFGECIEKGCLFVDVGLINDPQVRNSPWCVPPKK